MTNVSDICTCGRLSSPPHCPYCGSSNCIARKASGRWEGKGAKSVFIKGYRCLRCGDNFAADTPCCAPPTATPGRKGNIGAGLLSGNRGRQLRVGASGAGTVGTTGDIEPPPMAPAAKAALSSSILKTLAARRPELFRVAAAEAGLTPAQAADAAASKLEDKFLSEEPPQEAGPKAPLAGAARRDAAMGGGRRTFNDDFEFS